MAAESRCPRPILCEDLGTIRGEIFPDYGSERGRFRGKQGSGKLKIITKFTTKVYGDFFEYTDCEIADQGNHRRSTHPARGHHAYPD